MNDVDNASSTGGPTPALKPDYEQFEYLASQFRELQKYGRRTELAYEDMAVTKPVLRSPSPIDKVNDKQILRAAETGHQWILGEDAKWTLWTRPPVNPTPVLRIAPDGIDSPEMQQIREILELKPVTPEKNFYRLRRDTYGQFKHPNARRTREKPAELREEIVMSMRSVKEMMFYLSHAIAVPESHRRLAITLLFGCGSDTDSSSNETQQNTASTDGQTDPAETAGLPELIGQFVQTQPGAGTRIPREKLIADNAT